MISLPFSRKETGRKDHAADSPVCELYLADDDTIILGGDLIENLDHDLDDFLDDLLKE